MTNVTVRIFEQWYNHTVAKIKQGGSEMKTRFRTIQEALDAGFEMPGGGDRDVSGPNSFGYDFERGERRTVTVSFSEERNKGGGKGALMAMFPPESE